MQPTGEEWIIETPRHYVRFRPGGEILNVTFDHLEMTQGADKKPEPWGWDFAIKNNWSILGIVSKSHIWFREERLHQVFLDLMNSGFFKAFKRVVFAGGSKGGYGALAFSSVAPGSTVIAINPQSSLDSKLVPWETRYPIGDWKGLFRDGAEEIRNAGKVFVFYDPFCEPDRLHAERIVGGNVSYLRCRYLDHGIATCFLKMNILKPVMAGLTNGTLSEQQFWVLYRNRRKALRYARNLLDAVISRHRVGLAERVCRSMQQDVDHRFFKLRLALIEAAQGNAQALERGHRMLKEVDVWP